MATTVASESVSEWKSTSWWPLVVAWGITLLVLGACLTPGYWLGFEIRPGVSHLDKLAHFGMFALFSASWAYAVPSSGTARLLILVAALTLAVGTELAQGIPVIQRDPDPLDALADVVGAGVGLVVGSLMPRMEPSPRLSSESV